LRVITGSAKGYGLKAPRRMKLRPTPARVKEALFSSLAAHIPGARVLDLFAGTGAFGIEALSRGAAEATLVESDRRVVGLIGSNLRKTRLEEHARVLRSDVRQALERLVREEIVFDLIFADPPYLRACLESQIHRGVAGCRATTPRGWQAGPVAVLGEAGRAARPTGLSKHALRVNPASPGGCLEVSHAGPAGSPSSHSRLPQVPHSWLSFLVDSPALAKLLARQGLLLIEHYKKEKAVDSALFNLLRQFQFGDTVVSVFSKTESLTRPCDSQRVV